MIDPAVVPVRDSLVAILYVLAYLAETAQPLSELVSQLPRYAMLKEKIACAAGADKAVSAAVRKAFAGRRDARFNDTDGLRIDLGDRWVCARASNTEPILRIIAEAPDAAAATALVDEVRAIARKHSGSGCGETNRQDWPV